MRRGAEEISNEPPCAEAIDRGMGQPRSWMFRREPPFERCEGQRKDARRRSYARGRPGERTLRHIREMNRPRERNDQRGAPQSEESFDPGDPMRACDVILAIKLRDNLVGRRPFPGALRRCRSTPSTSESPAQPAAERPPQRSALPPRRRRCGTPRRRVEAHR